MKIKIEKFLIVGLIIGVLSGVVISHFLLGENKSLNDTRWFDSSGNQVLFYDGGACYSYHNNMHGTWHVKGNHLHIVDSEGQYDYYYSIINEEGQRYLFVYDEENDIYDVFKEGDYLAG